MNCPECGASNAASTRYCTRCGTPLSGGAAAGQKRKTTADAGVFGAGPATTPPPPPPMPPSRPASGAVRRTVLEDAGGSATPTPPPPMPMPRGSAPSPLRPPVGAAAPGRSRTVLDEGPAVGTPARHASGSAPAVSAGARIVGWMVSYDHNGSGQDFALRAGKTRIGRGRENEISLFFEGKASDLHCTLIWRNGKTAIKDEGSTNGTLVNGEDIGIAGVQQLNHGDTLTVGNSTFQVFLINPEVAAQIWPSSGWGNR